MFRKLRNKFILLNLAITTFILLISFSLIYAVVVLSANQRPPMAESNEYYAPYIIDIIDERINVERDLSNRSLLLALITIGSVFELIVALASYYMAEKAIEPIKKSYEMQKTFIANASHEIKTPLASISANLEAADIKNNKWINNVSTEVDLLTKLNNQLLLLASNDQPISEKTFEEVDLEKTIKEQINVLTPRINNKNILLKTKINYPKKHVKINKNDFNQVLSILLDNAIKYCDKKIEITVSPKEITIANDGTIINKEQLQHVFERFYQIDKTTEGVGLGLSIAKAISNNNNWQLIPSGTKTRTKFTLIFSEKSA